MSKKTVREWINQINPITDITEDILKHTSDQKWEEERNQLDKYETYATSKSVNG